MKVLVLAAGYGTRLYPIIMDKPKALLKVGSKTILDHLLGKLRGLEDLREILIVTNQKFFSVFKQWALENKDFPVPIIIINDKTTTPENRLGSVGDIRYAIQNYPIDDDLLVIGGDNLFDYSLKESISFAITKKPDVTIGLYDIGDLKDAGKFGVVRIDKKGKVVSFEEKPANPQSTLIAMCYYYFPQVTLSFIDEYIRLSNKMDKAGDYIRWLAEQKGVYGFKFVGRWFDIGSIETYQEAEQYFKS